MNFLDMCMRMCLLCSWLSTGGSVILQAPAMAQKKMVCLLHLAPPVSEPPLSPLLKWTPRRSSKLSSSPPHSPLLLSPPAHRPLPFASKYSSWHVTGMPVFIRPPCLYVGRRQPASTFKFDCLTTSNCVFSFMAFKFTLCAPHFPLEKE